MITLLLILILIWIIAGIVGFVVHGLFWLFVLACVLFVLSLLGAGFTRGRSTRKVR